MLRALSFCEVFYTICNTVGKQLGAGHSEAVYQKACGQFLQVYGIPHHLEQHVPVILRTNDSGDATVANDSHTVFHIGDERIDILAYDDSGGIHIIELKAISARVSPVKPTLKSILSGSHVQLLKYVRLIAQEDKYKDKIVNGYVVNFRQHVSLEDPYRIAVEFDVFDVAKQQWVFGFQPESVIVPKTDVLSPAAVNENGLPKKITVQTTENAFSS